MLKYIFYFGHFSHSPYHVHSIDFCIFKFSINMHKYLEFNYNFLTIVCIYNIYNDFFFILIYRKLLSKFDQKKLGYLVYQWILNIINILKN